MSNITGAAASLNRALDKNASCCKILRIQLDFGRTYYPIISRYPTLFLSHSLLCISGVTINEVSNLHRLRGIYDSKLTFEHHIHLWLSLIAQKSEYIWKCFKDFGRDSTVPKSFCAFMLPHFDNCIFLSISAVDSNLNFLDKT